MASNINVKLNDRLHEHLQQQIGERGLYENASEYVRSLIRQDLKSQTEAWDWLRKELEPAIRASEEDFIAVTAQDVISRNKAR